MEKRKPITEDDILLTELLIARSYGNLKRSVVRSVAKASSDSFCSLGGHLKKHPVASAGAAVGAGVLLFGLFRMLTRGGAGEEQRDRGSCRNSMAGEICSMLLPVVTPYVTAYAKQFMETRFRNGRK